MKNYLKICLPALFAVFTANFGYSQNEITITHDINVVGNTKPIPVSLDGFSGEVADVLKFDLYVQGFAFVTPDAAQYQISGSASGNVTGSVADKLAKKVLFSKSYIGTNPRRQAHAFADDIVSPSPAKRVSDKRRSRSRSSSPTARARFMFPILTATARRP